VGAGLGAGFGGAGFGLFMMSVQNWESDLLRAAISSHRLTNRQHQKIVDTEYGIE
jgi:hypothetical protein